MFEGILESVWPGWSLGEQIGMGSFGKVYECSRSDHSVEMRSAVKIISIPSSENELEFLKLEGRTEEEQKLYVKEIVDGCRQEIKLMADMKGMKNIVNIEDYDVVEKEGEIGSYIFIRMELLKPLMQYFGEVGISEEEVIRLGIDICRALEVFEERDIIHRDIKPGNILVNAYGDFKLADFGIARKLDMQSSEMSIRGNYSYMAPEMERGEHYDRTVDQYSLGLVLYCLLNQNRFPFMDTEKRILSVAEREEACMKRMRGEAPNAPCNASPALAKVILKACSPDPKKRYSTIKEFKQALESCSKNCVGHKEESNAKNGKEEKDGSPKEMLGFLLAGILCMALIFCGIVFLSGNKNRERNTDETSDLSFQLADQSDSESNEEKEDSGEKGNGENGSEKRSDPVSETDSAGGAEQSQSKEYGEETADAMTESASGSSGESESESASEGDSVTEKSNESAAQASSEKASQATESTEKPTEETTVVVAPTIVDVSISHSSQYYYGDPVIDDHFSAQAIYSDGSRKTLTQADYFVVGSTRDSFDQVTFWLYYQDFKKSFTARILTPEARVYYDSATKKCTCSIYPERSTTQIREWRSSNGNAVTIDQNGYLKIQGGNQDSTITCTYQFNGDLYYAKANIRTAYDDWGTWSGFSFASQTAGDLVQTEAVTLYQYYYFYDNNGTHSPLWNISYGANVIEENTYTVVYAPDGFETCTGQWWDGQYFEAKSYTGQAIISTKSGDWESISLSDHIMFAHESRSSIQAYRYRTRGIHIDSFSSN